MGDFISMKRIIVSELYLKKIKRDEGMNHGQKGDRTGSDISHFFHNFSGKSA